MKHEVLILAVLAAVTLLIRILPFIIMKDGRRIPDSVAYLGRVLPQASMGMLVVYCLRDINFLTAPYGIPQLISVAVTVFAYTLKKDTSLSVIAGTLCYIILVQRLFV